MPKINIKDHFILDPDLIFLNHGSFGATPKPVLSAYQDWQLKLESNPVKFLDRDLKTYYQHAREVLGDQINADPANLVYIPNVTYGVNVVASALELSPGDEILATDHEYGACDKTWVYHCQRSGATYMRQLLPLPVNSHEDILERLWSGVTSRTKLIYISHVTSPTAQTFPIISICERAKANGILTMIDGAHAPGHIPVDLMEINPDFYAGNCHKWLMAPKGSAFLYVHPKSQQMMKPLVISWGWHADSSFTTGSTFIDNFQWLGTTDPSAYLSVPAAIDYRTQNDWSKVQQYCYRLCQQAIERIHQLTNLSSLYLKDGIPNRQMGAALLPETTNVRALQSSLYNEYNIEIPCLEWGDQRIIRVSVQGYNSQNDIDTLLQALECLIPEHQNRW